MEEADAICGRIAILANRMLATGSSHQLRAQHGISYYIHIVLESDSKATPAEIDAVKSWTSANLPGATEDGAIVHGQLRFRLPKERISPARQPGHDDAINGSGQTPPPQVHMSQVFRLLEDNKARLGIKYYSVGETTLEQVFLRIVKQHKAEETAEEEPPKKFWRWYF
jgi:ABC-type multidrug transport system ATPase subunit